jgi:hypothetical protein
MGAYLLRCLSFKTNCKTLLTILSQAVVFFCHKQLIWQLLRSPNDEEPTAADAPFRLEHWCIG